MSCTEDELKEGIERVKGFASSMLHHSGAEAVESKIRFELYMLDEKPEEDAQGMLEAIRQFIPQLVEVNPEIGFKVAVNALYSADMVACVSEEHSMPFPFVRQALLQQTKDLISVLGREKPDSVGSGFHFINNLLEPTKKEILPLLVATLPSLFKKGRRPDAAERMVKLVGRCCTTQPLKELFVEAGAQQLRRIGKDARGYSLRWTLLEEFASLADVPFSALGGVCGRLPNIKGKKQEDFLAIQVVEDEVFFALTKRELVKRSSHTSSDEETPTFPQAFWRRVRQVKQATPV